MMKSESLIDRDDDEGAVGALVSAVVRSSEAGASSSLYDLCAAAAEPLIRRGPARRIEAFVRAIASSAPGISGTSPAIPDPLRRFDAGPSLAALEALSCVLSAAAEDFTADPVGGQSLETSVPEVTLFETFAKAVDPQGDWNFRPLSDAYGHVLSHDDRAAIERFRLECTRILDTIALVRSQKGTEPSATVTRLGRVLSVYSVLGFCFLQRAASLRDTVTAAALLQDAAVREDIRAWGLCTGLDIASVTEKQQDLLRGLRAGGLLHVAGSQYRLRADLCEVLEGSPVTASDRQRPPSPTDQETPMSSAPHGGKISLVQDDEDHRRLADRYLRGR
jgi:hypothetical protein